jgi:hypothetical protein
VRLHHNAVPNKFATYTYFTHEVTLGDLITFCGGVFNYNLLARVIFVKIFKNSLPQLSACIMRILHVTHRICDHIETSLKAKL